MIFQWTTTLLAVPLRLTANWRNDETRPVGSCTDNIWWAVENPTSPLASLAVTLRKTSDLFPILGEEGGTSLVNGDAIGHQIKKNRFNRWYMQEKLVGTRVNAINLPYRSLPRKHCEGFVFNTLSFHTHGSGRIAWRTSAWEASLMDAVYKKVYYLAKSQ